MTSSCSVWMEAERLATSLPEMVAGGRWERAMRDFATSIAVGANGSPSWARGIPV